MEALQMNSVGYASAIDLGDPNSPYTPIHPRDKQTVGERVIIPLFIPSLFIHLH